MNVKINNEDAKNRVHTQCYLMQTITQQSYLGKSYSCIVSYAAKILCLWAKPKSYTWFSLNRFRHGCVNQHCPQMRLLYCHKSFILLP